MGTVITVSSVQYIHYNVFSIDNDKIFVERLENLIGLFNLFQTKMWDSGETSPFMVSLSMREVSDEFT